MTCKNRIRTTLKPVSYTHLDVYKRQVMVVIPEIETFHDYDNVMRQYCPNGALIELDRNDGSGQVIFKGETVKTYEHVMVADINQIRAFASALR